MNRNKVVAVAALGLVAYTLSLCGISTVMSLLEADKTITNAGTVKTVGVGAYWDPDCVNTATIIDWGTLEPGSNASVTVYIKNEGTAVATLSMYTSDWSPSNASDFIGLVWDYGGQSLNPDDVVEVAFTLTVSSSIQGITSFSFDIVIVGSG